MRGGHRIDQPHAARVVEMGGEFQLGKACLHCLAQCLHLVGKRHAGGVAQRDAVHAQPGKAGDPSEHRFGRDLTLHRAAEYAGQREVHRHAVLRAKRDHVLQLAERLLLRHAQVGQVVGCAHRHDKVELVGGARQRALAPAHVRHQRGVDHAGRAPDTVHDHLGVLERRDGLGRRE